MTSLKRLTLLLLLLTLGAVISCADEIPEPDWTYTGDSGPANWSSLSDDYATCGEGLQQSPVDISGSIYRLSSEPYIMFDYRGVAVSAINNGRQVSFTFEGNNWLHTSVSTYLLKTAHLHTPSEHTIEGKSYLAELHFIHADDEGNVAVVALLAGFGPPTSAMQQMLDEAPDPGEEPRDVWLDAGSLIPDPIYLGTGLISVRGVGGPYAYTGSKTTPPCDEPVDWFVISGAMGTTQEQVDRLLEVQGGPNNRPIQERGSREFAVYSVR